MGKLLFIFIQTLVFCSTCLAAPSSTFRIGVSLPLTGPAATYGVDIKNALEFANQKLLGTRFTLLFEDDQCAGKEASSIAQKFSNIDRVEHVLGFGCSGALLSAAPIYQKNKITIVSAAAASPEISRVGDYVFRTFPSDIGSAKVLFSYISERHKKIGIISEESDFAQGMLKAFSEQNQKNEIQMYNENYLPSFTDFRSLLLRLRTKGVEGLFINPQSEAGLINIFKQVKEMEWEVPVYGNYYPSSAVFLEAFGKAADGIVFADLPLLSQSLEPEGKRLHSEFLKQYGPPKSVDFLFVTSLASLQAVAELIESGKEPEDFLKNRVFEGPIGRFSFDENGDVVGISQVLKIIRNGTPVVLKSS